MKNTYTGTIKFDLNDLIYKVHFPDCPIVPGSVIIKSFMNLIFQRINQRELLIKAFSFKTFVEPGEYIYSIDLDDNVFKCQLYLNDQVISRGTFSYEI